MAIIFTFQVPYVSFRFGEQYARMLLMLSMVVMYSISCPLITPFGRFFLLWLEGIFTLNLAGLVYFVFKHLVDKHNLAFVYARSKINKKIHRFAQALKFEVEKYANFAFM